MIKKEIYIKAIRKYGLDKQLDMLMEECGELIVAVNKAKRSELNPTQLINLAEEMADVKIMIEQISEGLLLNGEIIHWENQKLNRLQERLNKGS